jgi:hypothetical protein
MTGTAALVQIDWPSFFLGVFVATTAAAAAIMGNR